METKFVTAQLLLSKEDLSPKSDNRNIVHYIVGINSATDYKNVTYFMEWINLLEDVFVSYFWEESKANSQPKVLLMRLFSQVNNRRFSPIDYLQENIYQSTSSVSPKMTFKTFVEKKLGIHLRLLYKNVTDRYTFKPMIRDHY